MSGRHRRRSDSLMYGCLVVCGVALLLIAVAIGMR